MKHYEIVRQQDLKDCGACALLSIIRHYDGFVPLEKIRKDTHTSLEGTTAYNLVEAAKSYGFDSHGLYLSDLSDLNNIIFPAIAHVEVKHLSHFVVIYKINNNKIEIMDPAKGKVKMLLKDFQNIWTGNLILFYPKYSLPKTNPINFYKDFFVQMLKYEKKNIVLIVFLTIIFTGLTIFTSFYFKIGVNFLTENNKYNILAYASIPFFFLFFVKIVIYYLKNYFKMILNKNIDGYLYDTFIRRLFLLPNYFIKDRTTGEIMLRISELDNFKLFFGEIITTVCIDSILSIGIGIILLRMNIKLFLLLCFFSLIYLFYGIISGKILYKKFFATNEKEVDFQSQVGENLDSLITIKNLNVLKLAVKKAEVKLFRFLKDNFALNKKVLNISTFSFFLEEILQFMLITGGLLEILNQNMTLINLVTFESLLVYFINPFKNIIQLIPNYNCIKVNLEKINSFFEIELEDEKKGLENFQTGDILIKDFSFGYNKFKLLFDKFNLRIKENSCVLFKGVSGSGKSTLCQIISRLIKAENSSIKIGRVNINDYSLETIHQNITYVGQKEFLIQETIGNNIRFYREIDEKKFKKIVEICHIEEIVEKKPFRYETFLLKDSMNLSGGEKQRIILARALLNDFKILILDEALSEVNEDLEIDIIKRIKSYYYKKTIIYVSHKNHEQFFDKVYDFGGF